MSAVVAIGLVSAIDPVYGRYAQKHFGPNVTLDQAEAAGEKCLLTLGDSRMAAGIDPIALRASLRANGADTCVASLGVGALPISGQAMALRRYIADGHKPSVVVVGASVGTLLDEPGPDPDALFGNRAAELAWSIPSDVEVYYPGFPFADLDRGVRFYFARSNSLSIYSSALWFKTQAIQDRITGKSHDEPRNRFGSLADMRALLDGFREDALKSLAKWDGHWQLTPWFEMVRDLTHRVGARLVVLEVPMPMRYREELIESPAGQRYSAWLRNQVVRGGDSYVDISDPLSVREEDFSDGVHLGSIGAREFSTDLGRTLALSLSGNQL
jgi:hypothetical protein